MDSLTHERLADNTTPEKLKTQLDEAWHFEYWGPVEVGYINPNAATGGDAATAASFGWGGIAGPAGTTSSSQGANAATSFTASGKHFLGF